MSTEYTRYFSALAKYTAGDPIDDRDLDGEFDAMTAALNKKVMIKATAPGSPINGQTWIDTTAKVLKWYRVNEWITIAAVHVAATAMATPQAGDLWFETGSGTLSFYTGAGWSAIQPAGDGQRDGMICSRHDKDTIAIGAGVVYHGSTRISKTAAETLALGTNSNWIGGSSLRANSTWGYIYIDASGNIKLHTSAPDVTDLSGNSDGILRYKDFASTYYRCIGSFYMSATGSGELDADTWNDGVSNAPYDLNRSLQVIHKKVTAADTTSVSIPLDNSIPTSSEGKEVMSEIIIPKNAKSKLKIDVVCVVGVGTCYGATAALFKDAEAAALAAAFQEGTSNGSSTISFTHYMTSGTTSAITFKVRVGGESANQIGFNANQSGTRFYGGVAASSITITEIQP